MPLTRRSILCAAGLLPLAARAADELAALEARAGGRLGVALVDTASTRRWAHRGDERFALCSTFKLPLAGAVLQALDQGRLRAHARLPLRPEDRVPHMPATEAWLARGWATPPELARAAQCSSDNLAANVLLRTVGGPDAFTSWLRERGDAVTRVDRYEPMMNRVVAGDERDTTSPAAFASLVATLCTGAGLTPARRALLVQWMRDTRTGQQRLRAGLPAAWRAGDKTAPASTPACPTASTTWPCSGRPAGHPGCWPASTKHRRKAVTGCAHRTKLCWPRWGGWQRRSRWPGMPTPLHPA